MFKKHARHSGRCRTQQNQKRGAACIELAVCLPVLLLVSLGSIEGANRIFVKQAAIQAAYEAAKAVAKPNGQVSEGQTLARQVLAGRQINQLRVEFQPGNVESLDPGQIFTTSVTVPGSARSLTGFGPFAGLEIQATASMVKE